MTTVPGWHFLIPAVAAIAVSIEAVDGVPVTEPLRQRVTDALRYGHVVAIMRDVDQYVFIGSYDDALEHAMNANKDFS